MKLSVTGQPGYLPKISPIVKDKFVFTAVQFFEPTPWNKNHQ